MSRNAPYRLDDQIGFILRQANQRYAALFANGIGNGLAPTQWAALVRLGETGPCPQNQLGRLTAMDAATIKGVVERLDKRGLIQRSADRTTAGACWSASVLPDAPNSRPAGGRPRDQPAGLGPLSPQEQETLRGLLARLT